MCSGQFTLSCVECEKRIYNSGTPRSFWLKNGENTMRNSAHCLESTSEDFFVFIENNFLSHSSFVAKLVHDTNYHKKEKYKT